MQLLPCAIKKENKKTEDRKRRLSNSTTRNEKEKERIKLHYSKNSLNKICKDEEEKENMQKNSIEYTSVRKRVFRVSNEL